MRFDDERTSGVWITVKDGQYYLKLNYPIYYKGKVIAESNGEPIEPGSFLVALFNANFVDTVTVPVILNDLLETHADIQNTSTDMQKTMDIILECNPNLKGSVIQAIRDTINRPEYEPDSSQCKSGQTGFLYGCAENPAHGF